MITCVLPRHDLFGWLRVKYQKSITCDEAASASAKGDSTAVSLSVNNDFVRRQ